MQTPGLLARGFPQAFGHRALGLSQETCLFSGRPCPSRTVFGPKSAQNRPLRPDPPLAKPACRRSMPRSLSWHRPRLPTLRPGFLPSGQKHRVPSLPGVACGSPAPQRYARLECRLSGTLAFANALAVGVFAADTCGPPASPGPLRRPSMEAPSALQFEFLSGRGTASNAWIFNVWLVIVVRP